jgi:hypothetical protein
MPTYYNRYIQVNPNQKTPLKKSNPYRLLGNPERYKLKCLIWLRCELADMPVPSIAPM